MDQDQQPASQPDPKLQNVYNPLRVMRQDEEVLCEINRHPFGIIGVYAVTMLVVTGVFATAIIAPSHISNLTGQNRMALFLGALIITVIALLYAYIAHIVYIGNRWILTDDSLTQVTQEGLFRKHSSQLSLANLEDITADTNGIIQSLFGFGTLRAETAGEKSKFVFLYCPQPNDYARKILEARENFIMNEPAQAKRANDKLLTPPPPAQYSAPQPQAVPPPYNPAPPQQLEPSDQAYQPPANPVQPGADQNPPTQA